VQHFSAIAAPACEQERDWHFFEDAGAVLGGVRYTVFGFVHDLLLAVQLSHEDFVHLFNWIYNLHGSGDGTFQDQL
jgi:hypothetical protein